ncbi:zinc finger CCCH domain-containing protein 64 [Pistacia vera]|uniref:zinc finger CCCH domain-containing protein 64 n=1 Tax=Pistacia vera TaxID=55513 RepID=UPI0012638FE2|nr:zinc finger CCCH domain-containing protein 64 [Pistacia vera]XP_031261074.1 zinc finger CCCH domain-containing protein 64 [Pistacia vera]
MAPPRILLCGDVLGRMNQLFKRVQSVNKSAGPFDALLCVGQFFSDSPDRQEEFMDYVEGRSEIPLPTYFIGDYGVGAAKVLIAASKDSFNQGFKMDGLKISNNLFWLKGSGKFTLYGLSVVYLSGRQSSNGQQFGTYNQDDVDALRALAEEPGIVDLFLTNEWPSGVTNRAATSDIPAGISDSSGSDATVAELVAEIKPRYHIAGSKGVFYAREPYSNIDAVHVTRFLGLAPIGNKDKQKFIHAISPTPASAMSAAEISMKSRNTTLSPYTLIDQAANSKEATKRPNDSVLDSQYWRYDVPQKRHKHGGGDGDRLCFKFIYSGTCPRGEKCNFRHDTDAREQCLRGVCLDFIIKGKCEKGPECNFKHSLQSEGESHSHRRSASENAAANRSKECWFCLSSPNVESHLIVSIGEHYYCALPKGPLVQDHALIVPVEHSPNTISLSPESEMELGKFQSSLKLYYKKQEKETVFFEWVSKRGTHANLQAVPIPSSKAAVVQEIFNLAAEKLGFKLLAIKSNNSSDGRKSLRTQFDRNSSFFYVELPGGTILSHIVEENERFPAQFGREVLAGLLNIAEKADWRNCTPGKDEEVKMAENFKKRFEEFDPNQ